jgi:hypothetical protein
MSSAKALETKTHMSNPTILVSRRLPSRKTTKSIALYPSRNRRKSSMHDQPGSP